MSQTKFEPPKSLPTVFDPSFKGVGQKVGIEIWRIEKLKVVKKAPTETCYQGQLHTGDCYIVLQTKTRENALEHHIFFWLGAESSQDEYGCAAYKTVELDTSMGGEPVQHREVQGHETDQFVALFKNGLQYLAGGVDTGFKHVDRDAFTTRLLHVKGRRNIRVSQVELSPKSMNQGDVFVLDAGRDIYQWNGNQASTVEKQKALTLCTSIRDQERSGKARITVIEDGKDDDKAFWAAMGCAKTKVQSAADGGDDDKYSRQAADAIKLYRISDASGKLKSEEITKRPLEKSLLDTNDSFILDTGAAGLFAWIGRKASEQEKLNAMKMATDFIQSKKLPLWTPVTRIVEDGETPMFKQNFTNWPEKDASKGLSSGNKKKEFVKKTFDARSLNTPAAREQVRMVDDGSGKVDIWRIENFQKVELPRAQYGQFYGGDSYIILYTYLENSKERHIIYFWQGLKSSQDEKGASAALTVALDDSMGGEPTQVRVVQNKEPPHFYAMFKGKMIVHSGGKASGFKNIADKDSYDTDGTRLFQIKGTTPLNVRAVQVPEKAASLNSGDVFFLETPKNVYLWCGSGCTGDEREFGKSISKLIVQREYTIVTEGKEPAEFWAALGGKGEYANAKAVAEQPREPRLFQCSNAKGYFYVEEVFDFDQEDLIEDDVMILDTYYEVFVWIGKGANAVEKKGALETALKYVETDTSGRKVDDTIFLQIKQGFEPPNFTGQFIAWDPEKWSGGKSYEDLKKEMALTNPKGDLGPLSVKSALSGFANTVLTYAQLTNGSALPEGVDATKKEQYLSDAEFKQYLGCTKEEFNAMPGWKSSGLKKKALLY